MFGRSISCETGGVRVCIPACIHSAIPDALCSRAVHVRMCPAITDLFDGEPEEHRGVNFCHYDERGSLSDRANRWCVTYLCFDNHQIFIAYYRFWDIHLEGVRSAREPEFYAPTRGPRFFCAQSSYRIIVGNL